MAGAVTAGLLGDTTGIVPVPVAHGAVYVLAGPSSWRSRVS